MWDLQSGRCSCGPCEGGPAREPGVTPRAWVPLRILITGKLRDSMWPSPGQARRRASKAVRPLAPGKGHCRVHTGVTEMSLWETGAKKGGWWGGTCVRRSVMVCCISSTKSRKSLGPRAWGCSEEAAVTFLGRWPGFPKLQEGRRGRRKEASHRLTPQAPGHLGCLGPKTQPVAGGMALPRARAGLWCGQSDPRGRHTSVSSLLPWGARPPGN